MIHPAIDEWLAANVGRWIEYSAGGGAINSVQLMQNNKPVYGFEYDGPHDDIIEQLELCMRRRILRGFPVNCPGGGRVLS